MVALGKTTTTASTSEELPRVALSAATVRRKGCSKSVGSPCSILGEGLGEVGVLDVGLEVLVDLGGVGATELGAIGGVDVAVGVGLLFDLGGSELGELEGAGFDEDGVFGFGFGDLGEGGGFGRDDEGLAAAIFVGEGADGEGFGGGVDPEGLGVRAVGGDVDDGVVEEADAGEGGGDVGTGTDGEKREVRLDACGAQHGYEQVGLVLAVAVVALDDLGGAHGGEAGGAEFYAGVADLVVKLFDDGANFGEAVGGQGRGEDGLGFGGDGLGVGHGREGFGDGGPGGAGGEFDGGDDLLVGGELDVVAVGGVDVGLFVDDAANAVGFLARDFEVGEIVDEVFVGQRGGRLGDHADARRGYVGAEAEAVESAGGEVGSFFFGDLLLFDDGADGHAGERGAADVGGGEGDVVLGFDGRVGDGFLVEVDEGAVGLEDARVDLSGLLVPGIPLGGDSRPSRGRRRRSRRDRPGGGCR